MERIVTMDKELGRSNKTEVVTDDATVVLRRAVKLAQGGLLVSIGPSQRQAEGNRAAQVPNKLVHLPPNLIQQPIGGRKEECCTFGD